MPIFSDKRDSEPGQESAASSCEGYRSAFHHHLQQLAVEHRREVELFKHEANVLKSIVAQSTKSVTDIDQYYIENNTDIHQRKVGARDFGSYAQECNDNDCGRTNGDALKKCAPSLQLLFGFDPRVSKDSAKPSKSAQIQDIEIEHLKETITDIDIWNVWSHDLAYYTQEGNGNDCGSRSTDRVHRLVGSGRSVEKEASMRSNRSTKFRVLKRHLHEKDDSHLLRPHQSELWTDGPATHWGKKDTEQIKKKVRLRALTRSNFDEDLFHETGWCQKIVRHRFFEQTSIVVIVGNALWLSIDLDTNTASSIAEASFVYVLADALFYTFFLLELLLQLMAYKRKINSLRNRWFVFDALLVSLYTIDPFILGFLEIVSGGSGGKLPTDFLRLFRLVRLVRLTRLLRAFPELLIMVKGMGTALASVSYTVCLLVLITYTFAIAIRSLAPSTLEARYFPNVLDSMHHLLIHGTLLDSLALFVLNIRKESFPILLLSWLYVALSALLVMNMLIAILVQVILAVATEEKETMIVEQVQSKFRHMLNKYDEYGTGSLSWEEFELLLEDPDCQNALRKVDVDLDALVDMAEDIFFSYASEDTIQVTYEQFVHLLLDLRGSETATVKDVMVIGKRINDRFYEVKTMLDMMAGTASSSSRDVRT